MLSFCRARLAGFALLAFVAGAPGLALAQSVALTGGAGVTETFDSLANTSTSSTVPTGWYFVEVGTNANTTYQADDGTLLSGNTYSYGAAASTERAFGTLQSNSNRATIGAQLSNATGATLTGLVVQYNGEQWRIGTLARADRLDFQYSLDATSLTTGTWTDVDALDFASPITTGTVGKLDGNLAANRTAKSATIGGLGIASGATFWVRWTDFDPGTNEDGLAIDDVHFAVPGDFPPSVASTVPADTATGVAPTANITVNFSESVTLGASWYDISCDVSGPHVATVTGGPASYVIDPTSDFTNNENCTVSIDATQVTDQDGPPDTMAENYRFGFAIGGDVAPTVESTTPADNATNVFTTADVIVKFSESVTVSGSWFTIVCGTSGSHTAAVSGGPSNYTLNPDVDFGAGENCVVTIVASQVSDQDGTIDQMAANYVFDFTTAVGDAAPTVLRSTPVQGNASTPWATDISIFFSEPVSAPSSAFSISCASSGSHAFAFSVNTANNRTLLNPTADFAVSEACTVTVDGAQVFDLDGTPNPIGANFVLNFTTQPLATNYYAGVDASTCSALRTTLHNKIKDHTAYMYSATTGLNSATATWNILEDADEDPLNTGKVLDIYRNHSYTKVSDRAGTGSGLTYNREHTWPNSLGFHDLTFLDAQGNAYSPYTDTHMLYLSDTTYNANRSNKPYGFCASCTENPTDAYAGFGGGSGVYPGNSNWDGASAYEAWNHRKGDAARAVLYMDVRYEGGTAANGQPEPDLIVTDNAALLTTTPSGQVPATGYMGLRTALVQWANTDQPDALEQLRNEVIYSYQGNRNPFIDHPEWVSCLFDCQCGPPPDAIFANGFE